MKVYEAKTLIDSMDARSQSYNELREKLEQLKRKCNDVVNLDDSLKGKGADAIKGFYLAQIDVIDAWLRLIDRNVAFFNGISGNAEDMDLSGDTVVHVPFLDDELTHHARNHKEMVSSQQDELQKILNRIDDLIPLNVFSKNQFDEHMEKAEKDRKATTEAVEQLDNDLKSEYILSEGDEQYVVALFQNLMEASRQGNTISPIHFNAEAYKASDVYQLKGQAEQQTKEYLSYKEEQEKFREQLKRQEELENRPWYEKTWDGIKTFTGELTGYYDYIRASEGVDPVTGETLTAGQRVAAGAMAAAGFIPVVGWAGRIAKGGNAIYKTAKGMHAADQALDVYRTANTFSNLEKAEMGIYGLVSANGFSEYLTGKDMFGNALTEEQQQNSLYQALGMLGVAGTARYVDHLQTKNSLYNTGSKQHVNAKVGTYSSKNLNELRGFDSKLDSVLDNLNLTRTEFNELKLKPSNSLSDLEVEKLKAIRESVPPIRKETLIQKTIPMQDIQKYLDGTYTEIGGYAAKAEDVYDIKTYDDFIEGLRLDYKDWEGKRPFPENGDSYGLIRFKTEKIDEISIPFGERFGGINKDGPPCTLNGFTGARNGRTVPEFRFNDYFAPRDGAELYRVKGGIEELIGKYSKIQERFISVN